MMQSIPHTTNRRQAMWAMLALPALTGLRQAGGDVIRPSDFGARGDGRNDDTFALRRAVDVALHIPGAMIDFDSATYLVGTMIGHGQSVFHLAGTTGFVMRGKPTFRVAGTNQRQVNLFDIQMSDVDIEHIAVIGDPWTIRDMQTATVRGVIACIVRSPAGHPITRHRFGTIRVSNGLHALLYDSNDKASGRASNVTVDLIDVTNTVYGFNGANAPDNHLIRRITANNVFRAYFVYGVNGGSADITIGPAYSGLFAGGTCANVAVYTESRPGEYRFRVGDTRNITLNIRNASDRPTLQFSTNSMRPSDRAQGHYNIRVTIQSAAGVTVKVANVDSATGVQDDTTPYASPKQDIEIVTDHAKPWCGVDRHAFGLWSRGERLSLRGANFGECDPKVRNAYARSGWTIQGR
ncbi:hypothetical protein [Sphingomonas sp.]|uniref:hypothetical protein n=1 Tax=Sphingomonas sp. TaxID=28214 RepID=UPI001EC3F1C3|nr:hypothetical protein [Sphingomonas sp.]MBX3595920.1 hypothetical protein [Sphingomonas sp.]